MCKKVINLIIALITIIGALLITYIGMKINNTIVIYLCCLVSSITIVIGLTIIYLNSIIDKSRCPYFKDYGKHYDVCSQCNYYEYCKH